MTMIGNPLKQFEIKEIFLIDCFGFKISLTNSSVAMLSAVLLLIAMSIYLHFKGNRLNRITVLIEMSYSMISTMVSSTAGESAKKFVPLIFSLFFFILGCNLIGLIPFSFTATSHIAVTFALAAAIFIFITILGFVKNGWHYLSLFLPSGVPMVMAPLIIVIELFAYLARPVSLSIRLAANMVAGHIVLKVLGGFIIISGFLGIFPLLLLTIMTGFEIFIAVLQAYIFSILVCVYLSDALNLH